MGAFAGSAFSAEHIADSVHGDGGAMKQQCIIINHRFRDLSVDCQRFKYFHPSGPDRCGLVAFQVFIDFKIYIILIHIH